MRKLERDFYVRDSVTVARELLGKYLVHEINNTRLIAKLVEVEAYMGPMDKAAHSYNNRRTERTEVMFGPGGFAYVFIIYGMYNCMNIVTANIGQPQAILIRALEPIEGFETMAEFRYKKHFSELNKGAVRGISNGPGKLCDAMGITRKHNGLDLCGDELYLLEDEEAEKFEIVTTKRINIDYAEEAIDFPWRFYIKDNKYVSKK
jgi:DNA-3-methyladenine glycosylase